MLGNSIDIRICGKAQKYPRKISISVSTSILGFTHHSNFEIFIQLSVEYTFPPVCTLHSTQHFDSNRVHLGSDKWLTTRLRYFLRFFKKEAFYLIQRIPLTNYITRILLGKNIRRDVGRGGGGDNRFDQKRRMVSINNTLLELELKKRKKKERTFSRFNTTLALISTVSKFKTCWIPSDTRWGDWRGIWWIIRDGQGRSSTEMPPSRARVSDWER